MKKVTIQDIAAEMGLSRNTVAKALSGGNVSIQTRNAVVQKAWTMGYTKLDEDLLHEVQTKQKKANTGTIFVLVSQWQSSFWNKTLTGISNAVNKEGYRMQLYVVEGKNVDGEKVLKLLAGDVRGIIFLSVFPIEFVRAIAKSKLPMTFLNTPVNAQEYIELGDVINLEGFYSMNKITTHLIQDKGCRTLSYIGFAEGSRVVQARYLGYLNACNQNRLQLDQALQYTRPIDNHSFNYSIIESIIKKMVYLPDAFVCEDDDVAKNVAMALLQKDAYQAKKTIITGFNDTIEADFFRKDIITVEVRMEALGKRLVKSIIDRVEDPDMDISFTTVATYPKY